MKVSKGVVERISIKKGHLKWNDINNKYNHRFNIIKVLAITHQCPLIVQSVTSIWRMSYYTIESIYRVAA